MDDATRAESAPPQFALEYERPPLIARRGKAWLLGLACVFFSIGVGLVSFGIMVVNRFREDQAMFIAAGLSFLMLGLSSVAMFIYTRRP